MLCFQFSTLDSLVGGMESKTLGAESKGWEGGFGHLPVSPSMNMLFPTKAPLVSWLRPWGPRHKLTPLPSEPQQSRCSQTSICPSMALHPSPGRSIVTVLLLSPLSCPAAVLLLRFSGDREAWLQLRRASCRSCHAEVSMQSRCPSPLLTCGAHNAVLGFTMKLTFY